ncbi:MAG TPA: hypothetical protein VK130_06920 [Steroidobacteraceae bacterium]|nr:hypothetical protein [Steroidobacteraceae bacterium]
MIGKPWLRLYAEFAGDPKVQLLAFEDQRHYIVILCLKCNGTLDASAGAEYRERMICKALGLDAIAAVEAKRRLIDVRLIGDDWQPIAWDRRQYNSDSSAARTHRWRQRKRTERHRDVTVTDKSRAEQSRADQKTTAAQRPSEPPEFAQIKALYPKRGGGNPWRRALKAVRARLSEGSTWPQLIEGTGRYAKFVEATAKVGTEYVLQAATFFGPDRQFLEAWERPAGNGAHSAECSDGEADTAWRELVESGGVKRNRRTQTALETIGGYQRIRLRTSFDETQIRREFVAAFHRSAPP